MRIPLTKYGLPQVAVYPAVLLAVILLIAWAMHKRIIRPVPGTIVEIALLIVLGWALSFFRDPPRAIPQDDSLLLSPADGVVRDIEVLESVPGFEGKTLRIGIFLSIFNVHINRVPCEVRIESITYKPGEFRDAQPAGHDPQRIQRCRDDAPLGAEGPADGPAGQRGPSHSGWSFAGQRRPGSPAGGHTE